MAVKFLASAYMDRVNSKKNWYDVRVQVLRSHLDYGRLWLKEYNKTQYELAKLQFRIGFK